MLISRLGSVAKSGRKTTQVTHAAEVGGLVFGGTVETSIEATHAAQVGGLTFGATASPIIEVAMGGEVRGLTFAAEYDGRNLVQHGGVVEGLTFAASVDPVVDVSHAAQVGGLVFGASVAHIYGRTTEIGNQRTTEAGNIRTTEASVTGVIEDADAAAYLNAVEAADGQTLEPAVRAAINDFVVGCKTDGIWTPIKASCILAGARTLSGALVPLAGSSPTNIGFVGSDYNRKTGLKGDGSTKYLNSNRNNNADPQDSKHGFVWVTEVATSPSATNLPNSYPVYIGVGGGNTGAFNITKLSNNEHLVWRNHNSSALGNSTNSPGNTAGAIGTSRYSSTQYTVRVGTTQTTFNQASQAPASGNLLLYTETSLNWNNGRLSFYSIGESLDLALLDSRVSSLMTAFNSAIV